MGETNAPNAISINNISSIIINNGGFLWLGTINQGLIHMSLIDQEQPAIRIII
jgi:hypothetical protein